MDKLNNEILLTITIMIGTMIKNMPPALNQKSVEFKTSVKVTGAGILLLGLIGFIIFMIYHIIVG